MSKRYDQKLTEESFYKFAVNTGLFINCDGDLLVYRSEFGCYIRVNDVTARNKLMKLLPKDNIASTPNSLIDNIIRKLKYDPSLSVNLSNFENTNEALLNVANGVVNIDTGELLPHSRAFYFTYYLNFNYTCNADITECEAFMQFARTSLDYDGNACKTKRLLEMVGYVISSLSGAEKCFMLVGVSNSGKSVALNLTEKVVGESNTTNIPIDKLGDKFNLGLLRHSRVNINREISGAELKNMDIFKSICSGERLTGEQKYEAPFSFRCKCKLLFAGNCLPEIKKIDSSNNEAIFNRFCILYFPKGLTDAEKDLSLEKRMFDERDIIFSAAIDAASKLKRRNFVFTEDAESTEYLNNYKASNQALKHFVEECCMIGNDKKIHTRDFIAAFKKYCADNALSYRYTTESINAYISSVDGVIRKKFRLTGTAPLNGYIGLGLKCAEDCNDIGQD
jgi:putative DNA primase/helicase